MYPRFVTFLLGITCTTLAFAQADQVLQDIDAYPHVEQIRFSEDEVVDYEIGMGAMRKVRGVWGFKDSERRSGVRTRYTWQVVDGFSSSEVLEEIQAGLGESVLLFSCDGRSCGHGVQWANRVFGERLLYGRDDLQRYRVYGPAEGAGRDYRVLLYSASRTADRQYLHAEFLAITPAGDEE